jgi:2-amino-4-hydroxy-6-hydroxymethyldihydropteridine diphosphokinase
VIHRAYIGLGSNLEAERHLPVAVDELATLGSIAAVSRVYESAAVGETDQPYYLNAAVLLLTERSAELLCRTELPAIESRLGRIRDPHNKNAPRTIDLDLVLFDDAILTIGHRRIPDRDIVERPFLAVPLAEVDAELAHPDTGERLSEIADRVRASGPQIKQRPDVLLRPLRKSKR